MLLDTLTDTDRGIFFFSLKIVSNELINKHLWKTSILIYSAIFLHAINLFINLMPQHNFNDPINRLIELLTFYLRYRFFLFQQITGTFL